MVSAAFGGWQLRVGQGFVTRVVARETLVVTIQLWWRNGKAAAPLFHLIVAVFGGGFRFVQTLQRRSDARSDAGFLDRQPALIQLIQHVPQSVDGTLQH